MKNYIDVEKLKAEIERLYDGEAPKHDQQCDFDDGYFTGIGAISKFIDSLQQEQLDIDKIKMEWHNKGYLEGRKNAHIPARELGLPKSCDFQQERPEIGIVNIDNRIQYASIEDGIKAHAEIYSFNIESQLFPQLTKEQQALWRKEIEQACISGGEAGVELAEDMRYKENQQLEVDLENEIITQWSKCNPTDEGMGSEYAIIAVEQFDAIARHFCKLGRKQVLQEIYDGKTKPVDKITAAWLDDKEKESK